MNNWLDLDDQTTERIGNANGRYRELVRLGQEAMNRPPHPDADALRTDMREEIMPRTEYRTLLAGFLNSVERIDGIRCE